jgi:hypothetical protein
MPLKKYYAEKDATITNKVADDGLTFGSHANMGASDTLEVFSIYTGQNESLSPKSRILIQFPIEKITEDLNTKKIPLTGVRFFLKLYNVEHTYTLPKDFILQVNPISEAWDEGYGLDIDGYTDQGWSSQPTGYGCTWEYRVSGSEWDQRGGSVANIPNTEYFSDAFKIGTEDLEVEITNLVHIWHSGTMPNNGLRVKLSGSHEYGSQLSYFTKRFSGRGTQYFYSQPCIEARWEPTIRDDRHNFFVSSPVCSLADNTMNLYYYNKINGFYKNISGNISPTVKFYKQDGTEIIASFKEVSNPEPGIYKASVILDTTVDVVIDKWFLPNNTLIYTNWFYTNRRSDEQLSQDSKYILNITNLKTIYSNKENPKFNLFVREYDWQPNIYTKARNTTENIILNNLYYSIERATDHLPIIDYSEPEFGYTRCGHDLNGNFFELDMSLLEPDYGYNIKFAQLQGDNFVELREKFNFRVE